ncbi:MAG TPA: DUF4432 family protein [Candidatus Lumbricidophila sp.]|nr:DUF4432 family protein [Candidatus Lumbricidophila sp.]
MPVLLRSDLIEVEITPERGSDVRQFTDLVTGTPVLSVSPTAAAQVPRLASPGTIIPALNGYPGGWQLHSPNCGPEREYQGVLLGFHGESSLAEWTVLAQTEASLSVETHLVTAPLKLTRAFSVAGASLTVTDTVTNLSPDPYETRLLQHPAFGDQFLDEHSFIATDASVLITDADAPGTLASAADAVGEPSALFIGGQPGVLPVPGSMSAQSLFGTLAGFTTPEATLYSPTRGFGMRLAWDASVFPYAWFWIEANHTPGWPWFRRMYAVAIEPSNVVAGGTGAVGSYQRGGNGRELAGGETVTFTTTLTRVALRDAH